MGVDLTEVFLDLILGQVNGWRDDVARVFATKLDDVFAEVGFCDFEASVF